MAGWTRNQGERYVDSTVNFGEWNELMIDEPAFDWHRKYNRSAEAILAASGVFCIRTDLVFDKFGP
jgi:hypothetical protein